MSERRLLVLSNAFPNRDESYLGGIFIKEQTRHLKHHFHGISVVVPTPYGIERLRRASFEDYTYDGIEVYFPKYLNNPLSYFVGREVWVNLEKKALLEFIRNRNIKCDIIHAHYTWPTGRVAVDVASELSLPVAITEHTSDQFKHAVERRDPQFTKAWKLADAIVRVRRNDISEFHEVGISKDKVWYAPNGYDEEKFRILDRMTCRCQLGLPVDRKIILHVGFFDKVKGHRYLVDAVSLMAQSGKRPLCVMIGGGRKKKQIERYVKKLNLDDFILIVGPKPHNEIPIWMNAADIVVLSSLNEGNPTVMFESLGCGIPFVGTNVGGIPEIITSNLFGFVVEPGNPTQLMEKITEALDKTWDRIQINNYGRDFSWDAGAQRLMTVFDSILEKRGDMDVRH